MPDNPAIFAVSDGRASILYSGSGGAFYATTVDWLGAWPPVFEMPVLLDPDRGWSFAVTRGPAQYSGVIAGTGSAPVGMGYSFVDPVKGPYAPSVTVSDAATRALTVRPGQYRFLVGMEEPGPFLGGPSYHLSIGWAHQPPNGIQYEGPYVVGCSDQPGKVDGIETADGWLVGAMVPFSSCLDDVGPSSNTLLTVTRFAIDGTYFGFSSPVSTLLTDIEMVSEPPGGWVVYGLEAGDMQLARIQAIKMNSLGQSEGGPVSMSPQDKDVYGFDVSSLGDGRLAMVYSRSALNGVTDLGVAIAGANGLEVEEVLGAVNPVGKPRIWANPAEGAVLVAYRTVAAGAPSIWLARFGCGL